MIRRLYSACPCNLQDTYVRPEARLGMRGPYGYPQKVKAYLKELLDSLTIYSLVRNEALDALRLKLAF